MPGNTNNGTRTKILIVGAGIAGLSAGWRLAQAGCAVEIFERGLAGRQGTWAAAGMLAATAETGMSNDPHAKLARMGRARWPEFARELEDASGCSIAYRQSGALLVALDEAHSVELSELAKKIARRGERAEFLMPEDACKQEPLLTHGQKGALYAPDDAQVDNRAVGVALATAFRRAGGVLHERCGVRALHIEKERMRGLTAEDGLHVGDSIIIAAGAWSGLLGGDAPGTLPPVRPAKGQMIALCGPNDTDTPRHLLWGPGIYVVPRGNRVLLGATVEDCGFDTSVVKETCAHFAALGRRLVPSLEAWQVCESWAGLRPLTPDENPVLGPTRIEGLFVASGQFRNGILFAPVIAEVLERLIMGKPTDPLVQSFSPQRFI